MSKKRKNNKPLKLTQSNHNQKSYNKSINYYTQIYYTKDKLFNFSKMPSFDDGIKAEPSNEISQQVSVQNPICIPPLSLSTSAYPPDPARWHVSLALPIDAHTSPTMVFSTNKVSTFYNPAAGTGFSSGTSLSNGFISHHNSNADSSQSASIQQWYKPPQQAYNEVDKNTDERNHDNNNNGHKPPENTSASTNTVPASTNQGPTSISTSTSSGNVTNSGTPHNNTVKKKANTKFKYTYEDRISGNVKYKCNTCEYCTNRSDHYKRHLLVHSELKPFKCCRCGYCTGRSDHFRRHLTRHGFSVEEIRRQYVVNGIKTTQGDNSYRLKQQQQQTNQLPQPAVNQGNNTNPSHHQQHHHQLQQDQLQQLPTTSLHDHSSVSSQPNTSSSPKRHVCDQCGYATNRHSHFVRHSRTHSTERPYSCEHCGKRFKLDDYRKKHRCTGTIVQAKRQNRQSPNRTNFPPQQQNQATLPDKIPSTSMLPFTVTPTIQQIGFDTSTAAAMAFTRPMVGMDPQGPRPVCSACGMWFHRFGDLTRHVCPLTNM